MFEMLCMKKRPVVQNVNPTVMMWVISTKYFAIADLKVESI